MGAPLQGAGHHGRTYAGTSRAPAPVCAASCWFGGCRGANALLPPLAQLKSGSTEVFSARADLELWLVLAAIEPQEIPAAQVVRPIVFLPRNVQPGFGRAARCTRHRYSKYHTSFR